MNIFCQLMHTNPSSFLKTNNLPHLITIFELAQNLALVKAGVHHFTVLALPVVLFAAGKALLIYALWHFSGIGIK